MNETVKKIGKNIIDKGIELAKVEAVETLKALTTDNIRHWVTAEMNHLIEPLEQEIKTTKSLWVKLRNRVYIVLFRHSIDAMVANIEREVAKLKTKQGIYTNKKGRHAQECLDVLFQKGGESLKYFHKFLEIVTHVASFCEKLEHIRVIVEAIYHLFS